MTIPALWNETWTAALVNHLGQSTLVVGIAWLLALMLQKNRARVRYWVWMAASLKFLLPFSLLISVGGWLRSLIGISLVEETSVAAAITQVSQPFAQAQLLGMPQAPVSAHSMSMLPVVLLSIWLLGALIVLARFGWGWRKAYGAKRAARSLEIAADVPVLLSPLRIEPGIFGIFRPVLLLPEGIFERLTAGQLRAIVAHEMCHVRRRDNLTFALHMIIETLFWFHPAVWWIGARLVDERERACDEAVVQSGNHAQTYAEGILSVCKFYVESPLDCVCGVTGSDLKRRIVRIMTVKMGAELSLARKMLLAAVAVVLAAGPLGLGLLYAVQANAPLLHATSEPRPSFEVDTIKPSNESGQGLRFQLSPTGFKANYASLKDLIQFAYVMKTNDQLVGAPKWANSEFFDLQAKDSEADIEAAKQFPMDVQMKNLRLRVQSLLAERFQLKTHFETRELPVYALVVAKGGIKMKEVEAGLVPAPGAPPRPGAHVPQFQATDRNQFTATAWPVNEMTVWLSHFEELNGRIVVNETGLAGHYDWVLNGVSMKAAPDEPTASIFTALPEQLGLKLVPQKAPVEVLVIDHVEQPSSN